MKKKPTPNPSQTSPTAPSAARTSRELWFGLALLAATLFAYLPAWPGGPLWRDDAHITRPALRSAHGLWQIWFEPGAIRGQYEPLSHSAFWLEHKLWGDVSLGYHIVNIVLHAASAFLFLLILRRLRVPGAYLAALIFALHPVHVESVAWISALKNPLSGVFYLGAALAYLHFDERRTKALYAAALILFVLALLTNPVTATLPAALLVVLWWQRGRLDVRRDFVPLVPFFALGVAAGLYAAYVEGAAYDYSLIDRGLIAGRVIWFYLSKLVWPANLIFFYPRWDVSQSAGPQYLLPLGVIALVIAFWLLRHRSRSLLACWLLFCVTLFPVLGFFGVDAFRYSFVADHFQYLASLAIISLAAACITVVITRWLPDSPAALIALGLLLATLLGTLTWRQCQLYDNAQTLYVETLRRNPGAWVAENNLGDILKANGKTAEAEVRYKSALSLKADYPEAHNNLGAILLARGDTEDAWKQFEEALRLKPNDPESLTNCGATLYSMGRVKDAIAHYEKALDVNPKFVPALVNLGFAEQGKGLKDSALLHLSEAVRIDPNAPQARFLLGAVLLEAGRFAEAEPHFRATVQMNPNHAEAEYLWGRALAEQGQPREAAAHVDAALRLRPGYPEALDLLRQLTDGKTPPTDRQRKPEGK